MFDLKYLVLRNIKVFLKDKTAVFFSMLSAIMMLAIYFLFLGNLYTESFGDQIDGNLVSYLKYSQMLGGVLVINTVSLSLGALGGYVSDVSEKILESILVSPVKRYKITLSYYFSSLIVSSVMNILLWVLGILFVGISTTYWYPAETVFLVMALLLLFTFISTSIVILVTTFVKSMSAFGVITGVLGTFIAFISGIYMPYTNLNEVIVMIGSAFPFTHMAIMLKQTILVDPLAVASIPEEGMKMLREGFGINEVGLFGADIPLYSLILIAVGLAVICFILAVFRMNKKLVK